MSELTGWREKVDVPLYIGRLAVDHRGVIARIINWRVQGGLLVFEGKQANGKTWECRRPIIFEESN